MQYENKVKWKHEFDIELVFKTARALTLKKGNVSWYVHISTWEKMLVSKLNKVLLHYSNKREKKCL